MGLIDEQQENRSPPKGDGSPMVHSHSSATEEEAGEVGHYLLYSLVSMNRDNGLVIANWPSG
jgi:hypothetical protein